MCIRDRYQRRVRGVEKMRRLTLVHKFVYQRWITHPKKRSVFLCRKLCTTTTKTPQIQSTSSPKKITSVISQSISSLLGEKDWVGLKKLLLNLNNTTKETEKDGTSHTDVDITEEVKRVFKECGTRKLFPTSTLYDYFSTLKDNRNFKFNLDLYRTLIDTFSQYNEPNFVEDIYLHMKYNQVKPDKKIYHQVIEAYSRIGCFTEAYQLAWEMRAHDIQWDQQTYESIITGLSEHGKHLEITELTNEMHEDGIQLSSKIVKDVIKGFRSNPHLALHWVIAQHQKGFPENVDIYIEIVKGLGSYGHTNYAMLFFELIRKKFTDMSPATLREYYHALLVSTIGMHESDTLVQVYDVLNLMKDKGFTPNEDTLTAIVENCTSNSLDRTTEVLKMIEKHFSITLSTKEQYVGLIRVYFNSAQSFKAFSLIQEAQSKGIVVPKSIEESTKNTALRVLSSSWKKVLF
eukprot:TRINITY_DN10024_c0_g3_i1.p1 TRINITY_DN10024_c0_g3~~TRINITY_DN10024_c0_g3_i1.p1  ORF type:complete len:460 (+),score=64.98 TRINITY_DN10024_c0_g3_i1:1-1380(+)